MRGGGLGGRTTGAGGLLGGRTAGGGALGGRKRDGGEAEGRLGGRAETKLAQSARDAPRAKTMRQRRKLKFIKS